MSKSKTTLRRDPRNARKHGDRNKQMIRESLEAVGPLRSIGVDGDNIIRAGNGVWEQAEALGLKVRVVDAKPNELIAVRRPDLKGKRAVEAALYDNRSGETSEWYTDILAEIARNDGDLVGRLFEGDREIMEAIAPKSEVEDAEPRIDRAAELQKEWGTAMGQLWQLGEHRLLCGDSTKREDVERVMQGDKAVLLCTDPPYGINFEGAKYNPRAKSWDGIKNDHRQGEDLTEWNAAWLRLWLNHCETFVSIYLWTAAMQEYAAALAAAAAAAGIHIQSQIIWNKNTLVLGQADYQWKHENCLYGFLKGKRHHWFGGRNQTTVWDISKIANSAYTHPMQKPIELYARPIENHTRPNESCADPFCGSGTQIIACEKLGRKCRAIEISPAYVAVSLQRFLDATGKTPVLINNGNTQARKRKATKAKAAARK